MYGIVAIQLTLTAVVASAIYVSPKLQTFLAGSLAVSIGLMVLSLLLLIPLFIYKDNHPTNLLFLGLWVRGAAACLCV